MTSKTQGLGKAVLVVDESVEIVDLVCRCLKQQSIVTFSAQNADQAIKCWMIHKNEIGILLTDLKMPGMNGDELARRLTAEDPGLKTVIMSGTPQLTDYPLRLGVNFFAKPFRLADLEARLRALLVTS